VRMLRRLRIVSACALVLVLAGCGGSDSASVSGIGTESAATVAPASAAGYLAIDTDLESEQWQQAQALVDRFPGRERVYDWIEQELGEEDVDFERDVEPALGPETAFVFLKSADEVVVLTQPDDKAKLEALLERSDEPYVTREIEGWTAVAETAAVLHAFERAADAGTLADDDRFQDAVADLPEAAIAKAYVNGTALEDAADSVSGGSSDVLTGGGKLVSVAAAVEALDSGAKVGGVVRLEGGERPADYEPALVERVPDDALVVVSFNDLDRVLDQVRTAEGVMGESLAEVERAIGVRFEELGSLLAGEGILYARAGSPLPEVTLLLEVEDETRALAIVDRLAARVAPLVGGRTGTTEVDGLTVKYVDVQGVRISYTTFDGLLALTSGPAGIRDARGDDGKLPGDERFEAAKEAAGLGDETAGFVYVDLKDAIPLLEGFAGLADEEIPPEVSANLAPLEAFLVQASQDGDEIRFGGFLGISE
jgi:hypothetical protein